MFKQTKPPQLTYCWLNVVIELGLERLGTGCLNTLIIRRPTLGQGIVEYLFALLMRSQLDCRAKDVTFQYSHGQRF